MTDSKAELRAEVARTVAAFKKIRDEIRNNPKLALELLVKAKILTPDGEFTERYK